MLCPPFLRQRVGQRRAALEHPARRLDRIVREGLDRDFSLALKRDQDLGSRPEADPLPKLRGDHHLPLGRRLDDWHDAFTFPAIRSTSLTPI